MQKKLFNFKFVLMAIMAIIFTVPMASFVQANNDPQNIECAPRSVYIKKGHCGKNLSWILHKDGNLEIFYEKFKDKNNRFKHLKDGEMENYSFANNKMPGWNKKSHYIKKVTIQPGVKSIGDFAFLDLDAKGIKNPATNSHRLKELVINSDLDKIGIGAFMGCESLKEVDLSRVKNKEAAAFKDCINLTNAKLLGLVKYIGPAAFERTSLYTVMLSTNVEKVCENAFVIEIGRAHV